MSQHQIHSEQAREEVQIRSDQSTHVENETTQYKNTQTIPDEEKNTTTGVMTDLERHHTATSVISREESYPEGGTRAWLVVLGSWFALFAGLGVMNTLAVFQAYTLSHQLRHLSEGTVGWIFSIYTFLAFFCGVYIGPVFDKYGPKWLIAAGSVSLVAGVVGTSFCTGELFCANNFRAMY